MKYLSIVIFLLFPFFYGYSQIKERVDCRKLIDEGVALHDAGKYEEAVEKYKQVPENDTAYTLAVSEMLLSYNYLKQYEDAVKLGRKVLKENYDLYPMFYLNLGASLDELEYYDEAITNYDKILKKYPKNFLIQYNKGVAYLLSKRYKEAFEQFKLTLKLNPFHAKSHFQMASLALNEGKTTLGILALNGYLLIDPSSQAGNNVLSLLNEVCTSKYKEKFESKGVEVCQGEDYSEIDLMVENYMGMSKKFKVKSKFKLGLVKESYLVFKKLSELPENDGFWYQTYVPFFNKMLKDQMFESYSYYMMQSSGSDKHQTIVSKNKAKIDKFIPWLKENWDDLHRDYLLPFDSDKKNVLVFRGNYRFGISTIGAADKAQEHYIGHVEFYNTKGGVSKVGSYDEQGDKTGEWTSYYDTRILREISNYEDGKINGVAKLYYPNGQLKNELTMKNDSVKGLVKFYRNVGGLNKSFTYINGQKQGTYKDFFRTGSLSFEANMKDDKVEGEAVDYFSSGEKYEVSFYKDGLQEGVDTGFYRNGNISLIKHYKEGKLEGDFVSYYRNKQIKFKGQYKDDNPYGKTILYNRDGTISEEETYDETGKMNGVNRQFYPDGKPWFEIDYTRGEITGYRYFDRGGKTIQEDKRQFGKFYFKGLSYNGNISREGEYGKKFNQGKWKFYDINGILKSEENYDEGKQIGTETHYYIDGTIDVIMEYEDDAKNGYYGSYFKNGKLYEEGFYKDGQLDGHWTNYFPDGTLNRTNYYVEGDRYFYKKEYAVDGKLTFVWFYNQGALSFLLNYDSTGNIIDSISLKDSSGKVVLHFPGSQQKQVEYTLKNGLRHGDYFAWYPNGNIRVKGSYFGGNYNGQWTWYFLNGKIQTQGNYFYGDKNGEWKQYYENGKLSSKIQFLLGNNEGKEIYYFENGKISTEKNYKKNIPDGKATYYEPTGKVDHYRLYKYGQWVAVEYNTQAGMKHIDLKNETGNIKTYFANGKLAREFQTKDGWFSGLYKKYYANGNIYQSMSFLKDDYDGDYLEYYSNGKLKEKRSYKFGRRNGTSEYYYPNGKIKRTEQHTMGKQHGVTKIYNEQGKLIHLYHHYNDVLIKIEK